MNIVVYSTPNCFGCDATKRKLQSLGLEFDTKDITKDPAAREEVLAMGYRAMPVVVAGDKNWTGFDPDALEALAKQ